MKHFFTLILILFCSPVLQARTAGMVQPAITTALIFVENKGQVVNQHQLSRRDIDATLSAKGLNIFIGDGAIHYQWARAINPPNPKSQIPDSKFPDRLSRIVHPEDIETYRSEERRVGKEC